MNETVIENEVMSALQTAPVAETAAPAAEAATLVVEGQKILDANDAVEAAKAALKKAKEAYEALLPDATDGQMESLLALTRADEKVPEGLRPYVDFNLTAEQAAKVKVAKEDRTAWCMKNKAAVMDKVKGDEFKLTRYTVRIGEKRTRATLVFDKETGTARTDNSLVGLIRRAMPKK